MDRFGTTLVLSDRDNTTANCATILSGAITTKTQQAMYDERHLVTMRSVLRRQSALGPLHRKYGGRVGDQSVRREWRDVNRTMVLLIAWVSLLVARVEGYRIDEAGIVRIMTVAEQRVQLDRAQAACNQTMSTDPPTLSDSAFCNRTWDYMCWPDTLAGTTAVQPCPTYVNGFYINGTASRTCNEDGIWELPGTNVSASNWTMCILDLQRPTQFPSQTEIHMPRIRIVYNVGYGLSLTSLILAIFIMTYFKKLHCARNTIHINLFLSFALKATLSFLRESLLVKGTGLPSDIFVDADGIIRFTDGPHWECKLLYTLFMYVFSANYMWIFIEAVYLHMLIFVSVFSERNSILCYVILGWASPILYVVPWLLVRLYFENTYCWNYHSNWKYFWIIRGPIMVTVVANFFMFLNIVRLLFTKLKASNTPEARRYRYTKLAKSTLFLIPLFGVHYITTVALPEEIEDETNKLIVLYVEMIFNSYQGIIVAFLFCFFNGEVRGEIRKKWHHQRSNGTGLFNRPTWHTVSTYMSRARNSLYSIQSMADKSESLQMNGTTSTPCGRGQNDTPPHTPLGGAMSSHAVVEATLSSTTGDMVSEEEKIPIMKTTESVV